MTGSASQQEAINTFIDLANEMKKDGASAQFVLAALMRASAVYATYVIAGNKGALRESGITKVKELFANELAAIQKAKLQQAGVDPESVEGS